MLKSKTVLFRPSVYIQFMDEEFTQRKEESKGNTASDCVLSLVLVLF